MGTQTELTAEQIKQMEKDLEYQRKLLYQGALEIDRLEEELSKTQEEQTKNNEKLKELTEKVKNLTPNIVEKSLLMTFDTVKFENLLKLDLSILKESKDFFETGKTSQREQDWNELSKDYKNIKNCIVVILDLAIKQKELEENFKQKNEEMEKKTQALTNLQTQLDLATKTKEELSEYLKIYREMNVISFSSGSNSLAGNRFFSNLDDPQTTKVEKMNNFERFIQQHGNVGVVYLYLTNNKLMELGNNNIFNSVRAQEWLDRKYPKENRSEVEKIYLNEPKQQGLTYQDAKEWIGVGFEVGEYEFVAYLRDAVYPQEQRKKITKLKLSYKNLNDSLDVSDFVNLEELVCHKNPLTGSLNFLSSCQQLKELNIKKTNFNEVNIDKLPRSLEKIEYSEDSPIATQLELIR
ncbi:17038_t:CDS:2 [Racocetra persica]|uniref:17038_t:CDS:1 n=1 Tax=Racocetra persica TaxID=160502 RepID=A0ACA9LMM3_9GLOM|nr:17038_t:CDS:2 [Racocetra persica]